MPRTVWMRDGLVGSGSILPRSQRTWTSTVRVSPLNSKPHTCKQQALACEGLVRVLHEVGEQIELAWLQVQRLAGARCAMGGDVEHQVAGREAVWRVGGRAVVHLGATHQRLHAREQLVHAERLGQIVVGADLEPDDFVDLRVAGGEDQDGQPTHGRVRRVLAQGARDLESVQARQHQVEQQHIWWLGADELERLRAVGTHAHVVPGACQVVAKRVEEALLVLDNQHLGHMAEIIYHEVNYFTREV